MSSGNIGMVGFVALMLTILCVSCSVEQRPQIKWSEFTTESGVQCVAAGGGLACDWTFAKIPEAEESEQ